MIKLVNVVGIEFKAWVIVNDVQLFKELEQEGFELEIKQTDDPRWLGTITIAKLPCPLIVGYWITKNDAGDLDYMYPDHFKKEYKILKDAQNELS